MCFAQEIGILIIFGIILQVTLVFVWPQFLRGVLSMKMGQQAYSRNKVIPASPCNCHNRNIQLYQNKYTSCNPAFFPRPNATQSPFAQHSKFLSHYPQDKITSQATDLENSNEYQKLPQASEDYLQKQLQECYPGTRYWRLQNGLYR